jgi:adenosylhomocysteine nucleosidase
VNRLLVVTGVDVEARSLARHLGLGRRRDRARLRYGGIGVEIACAAPGARHLDRLVDLARAATLVVSAGTCGALAPHLRAGDLVIPDTVLTLDGAPRPLSKAPGLSQAGALLSVDRVVELADEKARLWHDTAAVAADMESAPIVEWAATLGRAAIAIRGVSDTATDGVPGALAGVVDGAGRTRATRVVLALLREPRVLPRALALRRGTAAAMAAVAGALRALHASGSSIGLAASGPDLARAEGRSVAPAPMSPGR